MTRSVHRIHRDSRLPVLLGKYSARPHVCWALIALALMVGRVALLPWLPPPDPVVPDEFSYLLAADTFAHGRVANPPLEHPEFFESPHILASPAYISKYPPGQGLVMALGQRLTGNPYWGVVLSGSIMVFLFCWATNAWLPPQWALIAGFLSVMCFFVRDYWLSSYWGGAVAASAGALVTGGLGYVLRGTPGPARFSLGLGAIGLYVTRPYEGGVLCLAVLALLAEHCLRLPAPQRRAIFTHVLLPNAALVLAAVPLALWHNANVTGNALEFPYELYQRQADIVTPFWVLPPLPPKQYSSANVTSYHQWELSTYWQVRQDALPLLIGTQLVKFATNSLLVHFMAFSLLLLGLPWARIRKRKRHLLILFGAGLGTLLPEVWVMSHYGAPFFIVTMILIVAAGRALWYRAAATPLGRAAFGIVLTSLLASVLLHTVSVIREKPNERARLVRDLVSRPGRDLVFVDCAPGWDDLQQWVYNGADLGSAPVIFAHDLGFQKNRTLIAGYPDRTVWRVVLGPKPTDVHLEQYAADALNASSR